MNERGKKTTVHKSGPSNILVDRTKSMFKLSIFVLSFAVKDDFPNSNVWVREEPVLSHNFWSILLKLFTSMQRAILYKGQWRKKWITGSTSLPQLHKGLIESWKLCLNLCSRKWLRPSRNLVIYLIPIGLW